MLELFSWSAKIAKRAGFSLRTDLRQTLLHIDSSLQCEVVSHSMILAKTNVTEDDVFNPYHQKREQVRSFVIAADVPCHQITSNYEDVGTLLPLPTGT